MKKYFRNSVIVLALMGLTVPSLTIRVGANESDKGSEGPSMALASDRAIDFLADLSDQGGQQAKKYEMSEAEAKMMRNRLEKVASLDRGQRELVFRLIKKHYRYLALRKASEPFFLRRGSALGAKPPALQPVASVSGGACQNFINALYDFYSTANSEPCTACSSFNPPACIECERQLWGAVIEVLDSYFACVSELAS